VNLAQEVGDRSLEALLWDTRGAELMREGKEDEAASSLQRAMDLFTVNRDQDHLAVAKEQLAELELHQPHGDMTRALSLIDEAFSAHSGAFKIHAPYYPIHVRAQILLRLGRKDEALSEFLRAVDAADSWRAGALPGDITNSQTVATLQDVYADYAHLAAELSLERHDSLLAEKALEVLAENRAASLREQLRLAYSANLKLPDEYYLKLSQLQAAQASVTLGQNSPNAVARLAQLRSEISNLENQIGLKPEKFLTESEKIRRRNSLRDIQHTLGQEQVLLSISLGHSESFLWTVTGEDVNLIRIPAESEVQQRATAFANAVRAGGNSQGLGAEFSRTLFSGLPKKVSDRREWLLVADGPLLSGIPFCSLNFDKGSPLGTSHSIRFLPSELLLLEHPKSAVKGEFLGIADPIYNAADSRLPRNRNADAKTVTPAISLARLAGSEREIKTAATQSGAPNQVLLTGKKATPDDLRTALSDDPALVHFAVHVVSPPNQPQQAALALSMKDGIPELLTPEVVSSFHAPGSLVVLSGCSSGQGKFLPGAGLMGLSRAWLLAGADAVIVSNWPTPDDSGKFFSSFYSHLKELRSGSTAQRAALALSQTQTDMLHGTGYQTSPSFWGAFAVISKE
jgi:CHAT domain-containing protein